MQLNSPPIHPSYVQSPQLQQQQQQIQRPTPLEQHNHVQITSRYVYHST